MYVPALRPKVLVDVMNILTYALPLLGVLAATSTDLANMLHSLLDPIIKVLR